MPCSHLKPSNKSINCHYCQMAPICLPKGLSATELGLLTDLIQKSYFLKKGEELVKAGQPLNYIYAVQTGSMKDNMLSQDGRAEITDFYLPGELIGLDAIGSRVHPSFCVALESTRVCAIPAENLNQLAAKIPSLQQRMMAALSQKLLDRTQVFILQHQHAEQRLAAFLINLSYRFEHRGFSGNHFRLSMSREDIASYLHLTTETVSRLMTKMKEEGLIEVSNRDIALKDRSYLETRYTTGAVRSYINPTP